MGGYRLADHFHHVVNPIVSGKGGLQNVDDVGHSKSTPADMTPVFIVLAAYFAVLVAVVAEDYVSLPGPDSRPLRRGRDQGRAVWLGAYEPLMGKDDSTYGRAVSLCATASPADLQSPRRRDPRTRRSDGAGPGAPAPRPSPRTR